MPFDVGDAVYWDEKQVTWHGTVLGVRQGGAILAVWVRAGYVRILEATHVRGTTEVEQEKVPFVDDTPVGPTEEQRHHH